VASTSGAALDAFDAILFDNDGVLVDTEPLFLQATRELLATVGVALEARDYHDISMRHGRSVFDLASARGVSDEAIRTLRRRRDDRYAELIDEGVRVFEGVVETLTGLHGVRPLAIVTSSGREHFERIHRQTGLTRFFEHILTDGDYARQKPHPEPYLAAARRLDVDPARCLVVEDTERGLRSARAAGMTCVVIPNALTASGDFEAAQARLRSMTELIGWIGLGGSGPGSRAYGA